MGLRPAPWLGIFSAALFRPDSERPFDEMAEQRLKLTSPIQIIFFFVLLGLILFGTWTIANPFWQMILLAAVVVFVFQPAYRWLSRTTNLRPTVVTAIVYVVVLLLVAVPFFIGLQIIGRQAIRFGQTLVAGGGVQFRDLFETVDTWANQFLGINLQNFLGAIGQFILDNLGNLAALIADTLAEMTGSALNVLLVFFLFSFFFVVLLPNWERLRTFVIRVSPLDPPITELFLRQVGLMTRDVLLGVFGVALVQTLVMWLVFVLVGIPFAGLLSLIIFIFALIPILGMSLVTIPLGLILIVLGQWIPALIIWGIHFFIINNIDLMLRPLIVSRELRAHPALVVIGFIGGLAAFGPIGLFVGPIIVILLANSLDIYIANYGHPSVGLADKQN